MNIEFVFYDCSNYVIFSVDIRSVEMVIYIGVGYVSDI